MRTHRISSTTKNFGMKNEMGCVWRRESIVEIKALFTGRLVSDRAKEIQDEILKLGITAG